MAEALPEGASARAKKGYDMKKSMDRRDFVALGAAAALSSAVALVGCSTDAADAPAGDAEGAADAADAVEKAPGVEMREVIVTNAGDVVTTNAADTTPAKYEGDLKDYFKGRDFVHQIGFYAPDWKEFAQNHHDLFGSGPFYHTTNTFGKLIYRGEEVDCSNLKFHACYGGWGSHSIEVVQQEGDAPTMFTEANDLGEAGFNHIHMFVEDLEQAIEACEYNNIPIVTIGYADVENALKKAAQTGADVEEIKARASKPSFMVVDMREQFGCMVQLIGPSAKMIHNLLISSRQGWDGETDLFRKLG